MDAHSGAFVSAPTSGVATRRSFANRCVLVSAVFAFVGVAVAAVLTLSNHTTEQQNAHTRQATHLVATPEPRSTESTRAVQVTGKDWQETLTEQGFAIAEGEFGFFTMDMCKDMDTCFANNPATPYGMFYLPRAPGEVADNFDHWCAHGLCVQNGSMSAMWRVAQGEAIVLVGTTPPECMYFSFTPYIGSRFHGPGWTPSTFNLRKRVFAGCPNGPARCEVFASVNDPLNHGTIRVAQNSAGVFSQQVAVVLAWDSVTEQSVVESLEAQFGDTAGVNVLRFPGSVTTLGVTSGEEDDFTVLLRAAAIADETAREQFFSSTPFRVFRVSGGAQTPPVTSGDMFPSFEKSMRQRVTGTEECGEGRVSHKQLQVGLSLLESAVVAKLPSLIPNAEEKLQMPFQSLLWPRYTRVDFHPFVNDSGYECLRDGTKCNGDCRDTVYPTGAKLLMKEMICEKTHLPCRRTTTTHISDAEGDLFVVLGVNHARTGKATYSTITLYNFPQIGSIGALSSTPLNSEIQLTDSNSFDNSAIPFLPDNPASPYLYAALFARNCTLFSSAGLSCFQIPLVGGEDQIGLPFDMSTLLIERMYYNPLTKSGPAVSEIVLPVLLHVDFS